MQSSSRAFGILTASVGRGFDITCAIRAFLSVFCFLIEKQRDREREMKIASSLVVESWVMTNALPGNWTKQPQIGPPRKRSSRSPNANCHRYTSLLLAVICIHTSIYQRSPIYMLKSQHTLLEISIYSCTPCSYYVNELQTNRLPHLT